MARTHGRDSTYQWGCRCDECREAHAAKRRANRKRGTTQAHGYSGYHNYGCRCEVCSAAAAAANLELVDKFKSGIWKASHGTARRMKLGCRCDLCAPLFEANLADLRTYQSKPRRRKPEQS